MSNSRPCPGMLPAGVPTPLPSPHPLQSAGSPSPPPAGLCGWALSERWPAPWPPSGPLSPTTLPEPTAHSPMTAVGPCSWGVTCPHCPHHCRCGRTWATPGGRAWGPNKDQATAAAEGPPHAAPSRQWWERFAGHLEMADRGAHLTRAEDTGARHTLGRGCHCPYLGGRHRFKEVQPP